MQNETPDFPTRLAACARQLRRHGFEAVCVADLAEAGRRLRDEIARCAPQGSSKSCATAAAMNSSTDSIPPCRDPNSSKYGAKDCSPTFS